MAENSIEKKVIVSISANAEELNSAVSEAKKNLKDIKNTDVTPSSIKSLKQQLKEATQEALALQQTGKQNTAEYRNAVAAIAQLRDEQDVLNRTVAAFDPGNRLNGLVGISKAAASGISATTGVMGLLGTESEKANETLVKMVSLLSFADALNSLGDLQDHFKALTSVLFQSSGAIEGTAEATGVASKAFKGLKVALASIGIGLLITAIGYLVANWDELKATVTEFIPDLEGAGETFNKVKSVIVGIGGAVIDYLIAPIKAAIALFKGDFKGAVDELKNGFDVVNNYQNAYNKNRQKQAEEAERELHATRAKELEDAIKLYKAAGIEVNSLEKELHQERIKSFKLGSDDYNKAVLEQSEFEAGEYKKTQDKLKAQREKAAAELKARLDKEKEERKAAFAEITKENEEANKVINQSNLNARDKELTDLTADFEKKKALYVKYNQSTAQIDQAYNNQRQAINKKYDDAITQALQDRTSKNLDVYQQKENEINKFYDSLLKTATDKQKEIIEIQRQTELLALNDEKTLETVNVKAQVNLTTVKSENVINNTDTPDQRRDKVAKINQAELDAENAAFQLKIQQLGNQYSQIEQATADHHARLKDIEQQKADALKEISNKEFQDRMQKLDMYSNNLNAFAELAGEQTVAGKALAVASTTFRTYESAMLAYRDGLEAGGPWGIALGIASAAAATAAGIANVKKILSVKVPGTSGSGSSSSISAPTLGNATAPVISTSSITDVNRIQDVRVVNQDNQSNTLKAYVSDKDLKDNEAKTAFFNNISTF